LNPYKNLKVNEIKAELRARGRSDIGKKTELEKELSEMLGGTTRLPALLHPNNDFDVNLKSLNLENYEVLCFEALHCSMNHIKNILQELTHHITDIDTLIKLKEILSVQFSKEKMRGVDYRKTLIFVTIALYPIANREVKLLIVTLCEMIEIFYSQDEKRSPKMILRLHNLCWRHAIQCRRVLTPPKSLTYRKLFGLYFHSCINHSAQLLRLISHRSTNAEMLERLFEKLSDITSKTWSKRIEDLSKNAILHYQVEKAKPRNNCLMKEEREISKIAKSLPKLGNTVIPLTDIEKYTGDWQAHLQLIADFLQPGEGVWWHEIDDCIEFLDGPDEDNFHQEGPALHHFRSSSITKEQEELDTAWNRCLEENIKIPITKVRDSSGKWQRPTNCLSVNQMEDQEINEVESECHGHVAIYTCSYEDEMDVHVDADVPCEVEEITSMDYEDQNMDIDNNNENLLHVHNTCTETLTDQLKENDSLPVEVTSTGKHQTPAKRPITDTETRNDQPATKKEKMTDQSIDKPQEILSKTTTALQLVLGNCEDVSKYDKLKKCAAKNPKSRFHIERFNLHLARIQISILKAYKQLNNDIKECEDISKRKQIKTAAELLKLWKITVHLD